MNFFYYKEKKGNNKIIHILGLKFTKSIVQTKCVYKNTVNDNQKTALDVFIVAFNNAKLIKYQILLFNKFISGDYILNIIDNSTKKQEAEKIAKICENNHISYYKLKQSGKLDPSRSHGDCLDWIYNNIIKIRKNNFCFLDHDLFPFKKINIESYIPKKFRGLVIDGKNGWFIWPGFAFFNYEYLQTKEVSFAPSAKYKLDTGGTLFETIYQYEDKTTINNSKPIKKIINTNEFSDSEQSSKVDIIDKAWIHTICGSEWIETYGKQQKINQLLDILAQSQVDNIENVLENLSMEKVD